MAGNATSFGQSASVPRAASTTFDELEKALPRWSWPLRTALPGGPNDALPSSQLTALRTSRTPVTVRAMSSAQSFIHASLTSPVRVTTPSSAATSTWFVSTLPSASRRSATASRNRSSGRARDCSPAASFAGASMTGASSMSRVLKSP